MNWPLEEVESTREKSAQKGANARLYEGTSLGRKGHTFAFSSGALDRGPFLGLAERRTEDRLDKPEGDGVGGNAIGFCQSSICHSRVYPGNPGHNTLILFSALDPRTKSEGDRWLD